MPYRRALRSIAVVLCAAATVRASSQDAPRKLVDAKSLDCSFSLRAAATWKDGAPQIGVEHAALSMRIDSIETDDGTADIVGASGSSSASVRVTSGSLHFLQTLRSGALYSTTVFNGEIRPGSFRAVHARHEAAPADASAAPKPEQFYGECRIAR